MTITKDGMIMSELKRRIIKASADLFDLSAQELESQSRMSYLMPARFAIYKALHMRGWAYSRIGKLLGKDHSTIIYGISRADYMIERDEEYAARVLHLASMRLMPVPIKTNTLEEQLADLREQHGWSTLKQESGEWLEIE